MIFCFQCMISLFAFLFSSEGGICHIIFAKLSFSKATAPQQVLFKGKLSIIIIFKLCKFNVNLCTFMFCVVQEYPNPRGPMSFYKNEIIVAIKKKNTHVSDPDTRRHDLVLLVLSSNKNSNFLIINK